MEIHPSFQREAPMSDIALTPEQEAEAQRLAGMPTGRFRQREVPPTPWRNLFGSLRAWKITCYGNENRGSAESWGTPPCWQKHR